MRSIITHLAVFAVFTVFARVAYPATSSSIAGLANDEHVRGYLADLVSRGGMGRLPIERAAFLTVGEDGVCHCLLWPHVGGFNREEYHGPIPPGTVAIVHTHPIDIPLPSAQDLVAAERTGLPFVIVTPRDIYVGYPDGSSVAVVDHRYWFEAANSHCEGLGSPERRTK